MGAVVLGFALFVQVRFQLNVLYFSSRFFCCLIIEIYNLKLGCKVGEAGSFLYVKPNLEGLPVI